jgi:uncharacterized protein (TIRG00374 family)
MKRWGIWLINIISLLLFGLILWWGGAEAWQQIVQADRMAVFAAFLLHGAAGMVSGWRLQTVTRGIAPQHAAPWRRFYYVNMTARALGLVLPRGLSTLGGKSVGIRALGVPMKRSLWAVLVDNLFDIGVLLLISLPALLFLQGRISADTYYLGALGLLCGGMVLVWWGGQPQRLAFVLRWVQKWSWLAAKLKLEGETAVIFFPSPRRSLQAWGITFLLSLLLALTAYFIGRAVNVNTNIITFLAVFPIAQLSLVIAVAPAGLGIFDLGWIGLLLLAGVADAEVRAFVIAQRAFVFIFVLIWAGFSALLLLKREKSGVTDTIG